ncbi:MAG: PEP-CTERM sorting domain-containing protein [Planctomycetota bacterium]
MKRPLCLVAIAAIAPQAHAAFSTYFGEDLGAFSTGLLTNTRVAQSAFWSDAGTDATYGFEDLAPLRRAPFTFTSAAGSPGEVTTLVTGNPRVQVSNGTAGGTFATDGSQFLRISSPIDRAIIFNIFRPVAAIGFTLTDLGDTGNSLDAVVAFESGATERISIPTSTGVDGSAAFFGLVADGTDLVTNLTLEYTSPGLSDAFGLDELTVAVPTPGTLAIAGLGLMASARRRR